ncbi:chemotaxis protein CheW [Azospirillum sp. TSO35-2]|uniref:chemotaxis protein CheW n=1 Tax=Azospirillum sp. TSO35-2 TaxID=716796 RepID=UPI000D614A44|nr:chemotaxis protein CheW [Azospirillum sp. TSO35-2]PWC31173.1 chemotaxis protein [Azospirillum sp. TSO35-2]
MDETPPTRPDGRIRARAPARRATVDWDTVHGQLADRNAALAETFAGRGPWADAVLGRRAEELAAPPVGFDPDRAGVPMLVARGAATLYGLELRHLGQIVPMPRLARVPGAPPAMLGVIAVAGRVLRLFDLDRLCGGAVGLGTGEGGDAGYAVVLRTGSGRPAALRLDSVDHVVAIDPPRASAPAEAGQFVKAITADRMAVLDMAALLDFLKT